MRARHMAWAALPILIFLCIAGLRIDLDTWNHMPIGRYRNNTDKPLTLVQIHLSHTGDERLYFEYANLMVGAPLSQQTVFSSFLEPEYGISRNRALLPYRDFHFEYPPLMLAPILLPRLFGSTYKGYRNAYALLCALALLATMALTYTATRQWLHAPDWPKIVRRTLLFAAAIGPMLMTRNDLFPAAVSLLALVLLQRGRLAWTAAVLGIGGALKLYTLFLFPIPLAVAWFQGGWRPTLRVGSAGALAFLLPWLPALASAPNGVMSMWAHHGDRGLQIESLFTLPFFWAHTQGLALYHSAYASFSNVLAGPGTLQAAAMAKYLLLSFLIGMACWVFRNRRVEAASPFWPGVMILILGGAIALSPIASPQFAIWLLPFVLALPDQLGRRIRWSYFVYAVITQIQFHGTYGSLTRMEPHAIGFLVARWIALGVVLWMTVRMLSHILIQNSKSEYLNPKQIQIFQ